MRSHGILCAALAIGAGAWVVSQLHVAPAPVAPSSRAIASVSSAALWSDDEPSRSGPAAEARPEWIDAIESGSLESPSGNFLDVDVARISGLRWFGRTGMHPTGRIGFAGNTTSCNVGNVKVPWFAQMNPDHPFIASNLYRVTAEGRLEQIGLSWLKHGFFAADSFGCGDCTPNLFDNYLNLGCQDTYSADNNADRSFLGPRSEVNPLTGDWEPCGSHFDIGDGGTPDCRQSHFADGHGPIDHLLRVNEMDLIDQASRFHFECYYVVKNDDNPLNNAANIEVSFTYMPDQDRWAVGHPGPQDRGMFILRWGDYHHFVTDRSQGDAIVASRVVPMGGGEFDYEYVVYNHSVARQINSFSIPIGPGVEISNVGFHAPLEEEEAYSNDAWNFTQTADSLTWSTDPFAVNEFSNTIRFGTLYTFHFRANAAPVPSGSALGLHKPGSLGDPDVLVTATVSPGMPANLPPSGLVFQVPTLRQGEVAPFVVAGARPGETVYLAYSEPGFDSDVIGISPGRVEPLDLDVELLLPAEVFAQGRANASGVLTLNLPVPADAPLVETAFQAIVARGPGASLKSNVELREVINT